MYCKKCGNEVNSNVKFCPKCGEAIETNNTGVTNETNEKQINMHMTKMKKNIFKDKIGIFPIYQLIVYALSISIFISCLLPFVSISVFGFKQSVNYISADGIIVTVLVILSSVLVKFKKFMFCIITSVLSSCIVLYDFIYSANKMNGLANYEVGAYLCLLLSIILSIASIYIFIENKKINTQQ